MKTLDFQTASRVAIVGTIQILKRSIDCGEKKQIPQSRAEKRIENNPKGCKEIKTFYSTMIVLCSAGIMCVHTTTDEGS